MMKAHEKIKFIRKSLGLTQQEFAKKLDIKQRTLSYLESGRYNITYNFLEKMVKNYKVNIDWFFNDRGNMFAI